MEMMLPMMAAGYLVVRLIADFYYYVLKREGLGLGDGKLLAMIGAVMGWRSIPIVLFTAAIIGSIISIPLLLLRWPLPSSPSPSPSSSSSPADESFARLEVPFGPLLAIGALIYLFAGPLIWALLI